MIRVLEGALELTYLEPETSVLVTPRSPGLVLPEQPHFVTPRGPVRMQVDFHDQPPDGA